MRNDQEKLLDAWLALTGQSAAPSGPVELPLLTGSMLPSLPVGAILRIATSDGSRCRPGEVLIFQDGDRLLAHRVLLVLQAGPWRWVLEKGDSNALGKWRPIHTVRGRVMGFNLPDGTPQASPANPVLASASLRGHLVQMIKNLGGVRAAEPKA